MALSAAMNNADPLNWCVCIMSHLNAYHKKSGGKEKLNHSNFWLGNSVFITKTFN